MTAYEFNLLQAMEKHGGGFAKRLATAWLHADEGNRIKLRSVFLGLLTTYDKFLPKEPPQ